MSRKRRIAHGPGRPQVAICYPCRDDVKAHFAYSLARLGLMTEGCLIDLLMCRGTLIDDNRNILAESGLENGATHVLFLDTDMRFPGDALNRLLAHDKPIVGINYLTRSARPLKTTAKKNGELIWTLPESSGLEEVDGCGCGVLLIKAEVFRALEKPWFAFGGIDPTTKRRLGEDYYFCAKAREAGFPVFIDHDLSKQVGHIGDLVYTFGLAWNGEPDGEEETF